MPLGSYRSGAGGFDEKPIGLEQKRAVPLTFRTCVRRRFMKIASRTRAHLRLGLRWTTCEKTSRARRQLSRWQVAPDFPEGLQIRLTDVLRIETRSLKHAVEARELPARGDGI